MSDVTSNDMVLKSQLGVGAAQGMAPPQVSQRVAWRGGSIVCGVSSDGRAFARFQLGFWNLRVGCTWGFPKWQQLFFEIP